MYFYLHFKSESWHLTSIALLKKVMLTNVYELVDCIPTMSDKMHNEEKFSYLYRCKQAQ